VQVEEQEEQVVSVEDVQQQNQSDKEASIVSRASSKSYTKEIRERQQVMDMSTDTELAQDDVKIVVGSSKHHHHHHKSKPNFMKEGPKYEEELL